MQFDNLFNNKYAVRALNVVSGAALLVATTWFSYNLFSSRDATAPVAITTTTTTTTETPVSGIPAAPVVVIAPVEPPVPAKKRTGHHGSFGLLRW